MAILSFGGGPALRLLLWLKLRGLVRKQWRRMRTVKGLILSLIGGGLFFVWFATLLLQWIFDPKETVGGAAPVAIVRLAALGLTLLTLATALTHRGLYMPGEEVERLFSSPVSRSNVVRYRLIVNIARATLGGLILGLLMMQNLPRPAFAFCGTFLALQTLPVIGQMASIASGALERSAFERLRFLRGLGLPLGIIVGAGVAGLAFGSAGDIGHHLRDLLGDLGVVDIANHRVTRIITLPFEPWARTVAATGWGEFALWFSVSALIWVVLYELAARMRVDFRELSLQTSADIAERMRRMGRVGGGASAGKVTKRALKIGVPWILGRGPAGAVAWRKVGSILRKARGTLLVSFFVLLFVVIVARVVFSNTHDDETLYGRQLMVAILGLLYLAGGLRFDFRDELDRMESIKSWPLSSRRVFFAMLVPEVLVISGLIAFAVVLTALLSGAMGLLTLGILLALPLLAFGWVSLDNAVYLIAPVRVVPGQEGALQNAGRSMLLLFMRFLLLGLVLGVVSAVGGAAWFGVELASDSEAAATVAAYVAGYAAFFGVDVALNELGAWAFRRFDVAFDRG